MKTEAIQNLIKSGPSLVLGRDSGQTGEWERSIGKKQRKGFGCAWLEGQPAAGYLEAGSLAWLVWVTYWGFSGWESLTESCPSRAEAPGAYCCQGWGPGGVLFSYMVWPLPFWIFNLSVLYLKQTVLICQEYFFLLGTIKNIFSKVWLGGKSPQVSCFSIHLASRGTDILHSWLFFKDVCRTAFEVRDD